jgi:hypothetical protein
VAAIVRKGAWTLAGLVLVVGLFPTFRAMLRGPQAASVPPPVTSKANPLTAAIRADRAAPAGAIRVLLVGNSVATYLATSFRATRTRSPLSVLDESVEGCGFPPSLTDVQIKLPSGTSMAQPPCDPWWEPEVIARYKPSIVFWIVSDPLRTGGTYQGHHVRPCDKTYDALYRRQLMHEIATLRAGGARVVITTEAYSRYLGIKEHDGATDCQNRIRREVARSTGAQFVDLFEYICPHGECRTKQDGVVLRPDGLHYSGAGGLIVAQWLMDQVRAQN